MPIANDRRKRDRQKDNQRNCENVISRLGSTEGQSISTRHESDTVFYPNSEGRYQTGSWVAPQGQATLGGIYRRLTELNETCLSLIESQQKQLQASLQSTKHLTAEINDLQRLLAETLDNDKENTE